ncbi:MexE family multidrug efflux RND transporter periplasmic adaptor subunit [Azorhizobium oxalatiphilum]|uniref:MexE family multidrug efflux RND transporter periplasmic adaptor subunit n=2 Tax=Azorhizobium oxalatiphilum TaxID=980631 RepID=A0A917C1S4_9HYPH|nr:MexE family multidrug efflux RND transporter periplasmic adaptor subunit [Azorhizobium oxalatiphilum]
MEFVRFEGRQGKGRAVRGLRAGCAVLAVLAVAACSEKNEYVAPPPPTVTVAPALFQPVTRYLELTGNTASINTVDLNARVQGFLTSINYKDGAPVKKGDLLFVIEQDQYKADLDQAQATLAAKQAAQVQAEAEYNRQSQLAKQDFSSQATLDQARAKRDGAVADVQNAQASVELAKINLGYTEVRAPFNGVVTAHLQDVGALVGYGSPTKLATIVEVNPIYVWFSVSETQVLRIKEGLAKQGKTLRSVQADLANIPVEVGLQDEEGYPHKGHLDYVAPQVDANTGTLSVRGIFNNDNLALIPGLFARIRLPLGPAADTVLVQDAAIGTNQSGSYVLVVGADNVVKQQNVTLGQVQGQGLRALTGGLAKGDQVVINGMQRAIPGSKVTVQQGAMAADQKKAEAPAALAPKN